ncbi:fatty acid hydroxylase superfamily-domain-containing protein [Geopyxis carbonaria]|nr:fatty acid hydroxylase superfamily-domain-containing protein [Geopyxis carbonaria]
MRDVVKAYTGLISSYSPLASELLGTISVDLFFFWIPSALFLLVGYLLPSWSRQYKTQPTEPLPTLSELRVCVITVIRNQVIGLIAQASLHLLLERVCRVGTPYRFGTFPNILEIFVDVISSIILCEFMFYWSHRILHQPFFYRHIHKVHHAFKAPIALAARYAHPLEYLLTFYIPIMLPPVFLRAHVVSMWIFAGMVGFESCAVHSGYRVGRLAERHDQHHEGAKGGYGTFDIFDRLFHTEMKAPRISKFKGPTNGDWPLSLTSNGEKR